MNPQKFLSVFAVILTLSACTAQLGGKNDIREHNNKIYCGKKLAKVMAAICYTEEAVKRIESATMNDAILNPYYKTQDAVYGLPWVLPQKVQGIGSMASHFKGNIYASIVAECCEKPCSFDELLNYC
ncbi:insulin-related peptide 2-like [Hyposmocoma kahamanoa]|uniref:insulin-related peptide 2-like n=1 Tax=Hyposmocoma kahamanoa TaxID=1477025 RepID=UPI000E6D6E70|nr:insulin-related peptide 2-like [Hyposmocoma kahamanoa]